MIRTFLKEIRVPKHSMLVFDEAYNYYKQFADWTEQGIYFVTRQKNNALYMVADEISRTEAKKDTAAVLREEYIEIEYNNVGQKSMMMLRRICYQDEKNRDYVFITNNIDVSAAEIALIYKKRCGIELLFKKMKQNFQLHYFYGENVNAIRT